MISAHDRLTFRVRARQRRLQSEHPPRLRAVLNEAVVRRPVGGPGAMAAPLQHLIDMSEQEHITIQILPSSAGEHVAMTGAFTMLRFPDERRVPSRAVSG